MEHPFLMFLDHTQRRSTVDNAPLSEWTKKSAVVSPVILNVNTI